MEGELLEKKLTESKTPIKKPNCVPMFQGLVEALSIDSDKWLSLDEAIQIDMSEHSCYFFYPTHGVRPNPLNGESSFRTILSPFLVPRIGEGRAMESYSRGEVKTELLEKIPNFEDRYLSFGIGQEISSYRKRGLKINTPGNVGTIQDAPFAISKYDSEGNLGLTVGFWYDPKRGHIVVSQIQGNKSSNLVIEEAKNGVTLGKQGLNLLETVLPYFPQTRTIFYKADYHPMFVQFPDRKGRLKGIIKSTYDGTCRKENFERDKHTFFKQFI